MTKSLKRIVASALVLCMVMSMGILSAFAAGPYEDGNYTGTVTFLHETKDQASMCNVLFDHDADIVVNGENATISVYAAYPVPTFADQGVDGTVKNVVMTLDGVQYPAVSDINTKPMREMDETNPAFGVEAGKSLSTQILSFTVPAAKLGTMAAAPAKTDAYVNVVMNTDVVFRIKLENIAKVGGGSEPDPDPVLPNETRTDKMQITAVIEAPAPTYSVTVPEAVAMGTLSDKEENSTAYTVDVTADNLGNGKVVVTSAAEGQLTNGDNTLAYANSFGTQETSVTAKLNGAFSVTADAVKAAAAGDYSGTANFDISYFAAK